MAQWNGQYTGNSHVTKVQDLEITLQNAIKLFRESNLEKSSISKEKAVLKLTEKLFAARLKLLKAIIYDSQPVTENSKDSQNRKKIDNLRRKLEISEQTGVEGILKEFGVNEVIQFSHKKSS